MNHWSKQEQIAHDKELIHGRHIRYIRNLISNIEAKRCQAQHTHNPNTWAVRRCLTIKKERHPTQNDEHDTWNVDLKDIEACMTFQFNLHSNEFKFLIVFVQNEIKIEWKELINNNNYYSSLSLLNSSLFLTNQTEII